MIATVNGPDGSGKSQIINSLSIPKKLIVLHHHSRPGNIIPKRNSKKTNRFVNCPEKVSKRNFFLQVTKLALFLIEFHLFAIFHKFLKRKKLVILERSLIDLYVHPARYGIDCWLVEKFRIFFTEWYSDLNVLLTGDVYIIEKRKEELKASKIIKLHDRYFSQLNRAPEKLLMINTTSNSVPESVDQIFVRLKKLLEEN